MRHGQTATIELTCILLPDEPEKAEIERTEETRDMWERAAEIAERFGASKNFSEHYDPGDACLYGDAYLYAPISKLEKILNALDKADVQYDNIDLPANVSTTLVKKLLKRFPEGTGVMVNY